MPETTPTSVAPLPEAEITTPAVNHSQEKRRLYLLIAALTVVILLLIGLVLWQSTRANTSNSNCATDSDNNASGTQLEGTDAVNDTPDADINTDAEVDVAASLRDQQRRITVDNIHRMVSAYYADTLSYPAVSAISISDTEIKIDGYSFTGIPLSSHLKVSTQTDDEGTLYCYSLESEGGIVLGAKLESGGYYNVGDSNCSDNTTSFFLSL